jgi:hypothetical protein
LVVSESSEISSEYNSVAKWMKGDFVLKSNPLDDRITNNKQLSTNNSTEILTNPIDHQRRMGNCPDPFTETIDEASD